MSTRLSKSKQSARSRSKADHEDGAEGKVVSGASLDMEVRLPQETSAGLGMTQIRMKDSNKEEPLPSKKALC